MTAGDWWTLGAVLVLIVLAGVFAASEIALSRIGRVHALHLSEEGKRGSGYLVRISHDPARFLNPVLVATLACHILGTTLATTVAVRNLGGAGEWVASAVMTSTIFVFAESAPKTFTILNTDRVGLALAPVIYGLGRVLHPVARLLVGISNVLLPGKGLPQGPFMTEDEIRQIVDQAEEEAVIEEQEREMIHSIFEMGDTVVREVMVPRPDMVVVQANRPIREAMDLAIRKGFSRIPVYEGEPDDIVGVVLAKDLFKALRRGRDGDVTVREAMRDAYFVPETIRVSDLLRTMQQQNVHLVICVDEYGDVAGLASLEDVLEEIVGEITDEYDIEEPNIMPVDERRWRVNAKMPIRELNELLDTELPEDQEWDTVGGLVASILGKIPDEGEELTYEGLGFRAERVQRRRIGTLLVTRLEQPETAEDASGDGHV